MPIIYKKPNISELEQLCKLNDYLFELSIANFDGTLDKNWQESDKYKKFFSKYFKTNNFLLVAYDNENMIGYVSGSIRKSEEYRKPFIIAEMENLMVLPNYQKQKIGSTLLQEFTKWAKSKNAKRINISVFAKNTKALEFYRKLGYADYGINLEREI